MSRSRATHGGRVLALAVLASMMAGAFPAAAAAAGARTQIPIIAAGDAYRQRNLVSDVAGLSLVQDELLANPWGVAMTAVSPLWVMNYGTSSAAVIRGGVSGRPVLPDPKVYTVPDGLPTGAVVNPTPGFVLPGQCATMPTRACAAQVLVSSATGNISGWNPNAPAAGSTKFVNAVSAPGHVYNGLAIANNGTANYLYASDFANGAIDVYDASFALQPTASFPFSDPTIPTTSGNTFHPYNIQNIGGSLYVTYAKVGSGGLPEPGIGNGYVRRFNTKGVRDLTFGINNGPLNSPWGITIAPATFGVFGGALLIGNATAGNPSIHAFNPTTGAFLGTLQNDAGNGIEIDTLHALVFGNGANGGDVNTLYFTAGIGGGEHGLVGSLTPSLGPARSLVHFSTDDFAIGEGYAGIQVTVARSGDASASATVQYATWDESIAGRASQKSDYETNTGIVVFAPGETSKTFTVRLVNDRFVEGTEQIHLALSNPVGSGLALGAPSAAELTIIDNDATPPTSNPVDDTRFFVRQTYIDLLGREPDAASFTRWVNAIDSCGTNATCRASQRTGVSSAILLSGEMADSLGLSFRLERAAFGGDPYYGQVMMDAQARRARGLSALMAQIVSDPRFVGAYRSVSNSTYVNALVGHSAYPFSAARKTAWVNGLNNATMTRSSVLLDLARDAGYVSLVQRRWLTLEHFWAYMRRDPDLVGFSFWFNKLSAGGTTNFVRDTLANLEYRQRFGPS